MVINLKGKIVSYANILSKNEENIFNTPPKLNRNEQVILLNPQVSLLNKLVLFENDTNKAIFILMYGYFKLSNKFYSIENYLESSNSYVLELFSLNDLNGLEISKRRFQQYQKEIRSILLIDNYEEKAVETLQKAADKLANNFINRKAIFYSLVELSKKLNIEIPSYTELSRIITLALNSQKKDILDKLLPYMADKRLEVLDEFLQKDTNSKNRWNLTYYKKMEHSTKKSQMVLSLQKFQVIKSKFEILK